MFRFLTSRQRRYKFFRLVTRICGFIVGIIFTALGAAGFILIGISIYKDPWTIPVLAFPLIIALLSVLFGVKAIRDTVRSLRNHWLNGVDLDKQPWMVNAEWRNRLIVYRIGVVPVVRVLWILASVVIFGISVYAVLTVPTTILVIAGLISCAIVAVLGYLYRYLKEKNVVITLRDVVPLIFILPVMIILPSASGLFAPATNRLSGLVGGILLVSGIASIFVYLFLKARKFGISTCHLKTLPAFIGGTLEAEIEIAFPKMKTGLPELPEGPVEVELLNFTAAGRSQHVNWMTKSTIPAYTVMRPGDGTLRIPDEVEIPNEARMKKTGHGWLEGSGWKLQIRAPFPGVDYASWFIVSVYFPESEG